MPLFSTILIAVGKVNFTNLSRYSTLNERTYRRQFEQEVDFARLNRTLVEQCIEPTHQLLAVMELLVHRQKWQSDCWARLARGTGVPIELSRA